MGTHRRRAQKVLFSHLKPGTDPYASLFEPHRRSGHFFNKVPVARDVAPKDVAPETTDNKEKL